jgi:purine nucleosidase
MGLDVTHQVLATPPRVSRIRALGTNAGETVASMLQYFNRFDTEKYGSEGAPLHDPCTIAYLLKPGLFRGKHVRIDIETGSELTMGATAVDFWGVTGKPPNALWMHGVDADGLFDLLTERLGRL